MGGAGASGRRARWTQVGSDQRQASKWRLSWLSSTHVDVFMQLARDPTLPVAGLARVLGIERQVCEAILADLKAAGFVDAAETVHGKTLAIATSLPLPSRDELVALHVHKKLNARSVPRLRQQAANAGTRGPSRK
jgi:hypothetical protein